MLGSSVFTISRFRPRRYSSTLTDAVVHRVGADYSSREYLLLPAGATTDPSNALASLRSHRNIIFGARLGPRSEEYDDWNLSTVCGRLVERALDDCSAEGEQVQAISALHGLSDWVTRNWDSLDELKDMDDISKEAAYAIATGIPRSGHSVVGQGTFRDGAEAWKRLATAYPADESQLYMNHGANLLHIEHMADTSPSYLKSAGGAMARFVFL